MYSIEDYEKAKEELARWRQKWDNYSGNNPNKYQSEIKVASRKVAEIEKYLKDAGDIALTENEKIEKELDRAFPDARIGEVVLYNGKKYRCCFFPIEKSRSGKTVARWGKYWKPVNS